MRKITSAGVVALVALASCAHEMTAHKDVVEEKLEFAPDPPAPTASAEEQQPTDDVPPDALLDAGVAADPDAGSL